jgi:hypothetical protein
MACCSVKKSTGTTLPFLYRQVKTVCKASGLALRVIQQYDSYILIKYTWVKLNSQNALQYKITVHGVQHLAQQPTSPNIL